MTHPDLFEMQTHRQFEYRGQNQNQGQGSFSGANRAGGGNGTVNPYPQFQRERAASQPRPMTEQDHSQSVATPTTAAGIAGNSSPFHDNAPSTSPSLSPTIRFTQPSLSGGFHNPWVSQSHPRIPSFSRTTSHPGGSAMNAGSGGSSGLGFSPQGIPVPTRSSSFSAPSGSSAPGSSQTYLSSVRDNLRFTSTFEDDESEALSDSYSFEEGGANARANGNGEHRLYPQAQYGTDSARSRSQSLLVPPSPASVEFARGWRDTPSGSASITGRQNSSFASSSDFLSPATPTAIPGRSRTQTADISNISPFRRDIHQILMGDSPTAPVHSVGVGGGHYARQGLGLGTLGPPGAPSVLGGHGHREDPLGGTSGTTSRRHSMSIYHPRRDIHVGFQTSDLSSALDDAASSTAAFTPLFRSNVLSDEELASGLGGGSSGIGSITTGLQSLTMSASAPGHTGMQSQPSSLPNFTHSRAGGLLGSPEHSRFLSGPSPAPGSTPGTSGRGLSPHRPSVSPSLSRTATAGAAASSHLDAASDRAASVSPRSDVMGGNTFGVGGLGLGGTNAMGMSIGMTQNPYGRFVSTEMEYGGLSPPSGTGALGVSTGPGPGRFLPPSASLSMYPAAPGRAGPPGMMPTSPASTNFTPTRFGHAHTPSFGSISMGGAPSINTTGLGTTQTSGGGNPTSPLSSTSDELNDLGRGVPLHSVPLSYQLFIVEFKAGRTDLFYTTDRSNDIKLGDLVIVEADRGKDLGKVINDTITTTDVEAYQRAQQAQTQQLEAQFGESTAGSSGNGPTGRRDINPKRIYGKAGPQETQYVLVCNIHPVPPCIHSALLFCSLLAQKVQDEMKALQLCQTKVRSKKLPMEVVDAEYQWYVLDSPC